MRLVLTNHYPFPYPENVSQEGAERISNEATDRTLEIPGVTHFEQKHAVTVAFKDKAHYDHAQAATGWVRWGSIGLILKADVAKDEGYGPFPAIVTGGDAWCGVILESETLTITTTTHD